MATRSILSYFILLLSLCYFILLLWISTPGNISKSYSGEGRGRSTMRLNTMSPRGPQKYHCAATAVNYSNCCTFAGKIKFSQSTKFFLILPLNTNHHAPNCKEVIIQIFTLLCIHIKVNTIQRSDFSMLYIQLIS